MTTPCPHCGEDHSKPPRHCLDEDAWTDAERDAWREVAKKRDPAIQFAPSTQEMADRFGAVYRLLSEERPNRREQAGVEQNARCPETDKRIYWKEKLARRAVSRAGKRGEGPFRAYECEHCGHWHLTTQPKRENVGA